MNNCKTLPPQSQGKPPCIPEMSEFAVIMGFAVLFYVAIKQRLK